MTLCQISLSCTDWKGEQRVTKNRSRKHEGRRETVAGSNDGPCEGLCAIKGNLEKLQPETGSCKCSLG